MRQGNRTEKIRIDFGGGSYRTWRRDGLIYTNVGNETIRAETLSGLREGIIEAKKRQGGMR